LEVASADTAVKIENETTEASQDNN